VIRDSLTNEKRTPREHARLMLERELQGFHWFVHEHTDDWDEMTQREKDAYCAQVDRFMRRIDKILKPRKPRK
jgi:hypothetical protein